MNIDEFDKKIGALEIQRKVLREELQNTLKDKSILLKERWNLLEKYGESILDINGWIEYFEVLEEAKICYYDHLYIQRYETAIYTHMIELLEGDEDDEDDEERLTQEQVNKLKEEMLQTGHYGFTHDW